MGIAGYTPIMTISGYIRIDALVGRSVILWNGNEWIQTIIKLLNIDQSLQRVHLNDGTHVDCTYLNDFRIGKSCNQQQKMPIIRSNTYKALKAFDIPHHESIIHKLPWLASKFDIDSNFAQITSNNNDYDWLCEIQLLAHSLGTSPFIVDDHLRFSNLDMYVLTAQLMLPYDTSTLNDVESPPLVVESIEDLQTTDDTYGTDKTVRILASGVYLYSTV
jgi:hypothetical protein